MSKVTCGLCDREILPTDAFQVRNNGVTTWECKSERGKCSQVQYKNAEAKARENKAEDKPKYKERKTSGNGDKREQLAEIGRNMDELILSANQYRDGTQRYIPKDEFEAFGETPGITQLIWNLSFSKRYWTIRRLLPDKNKKQKRQSTTISSRGTRGC